MQSKKLIGYELALSEFANNVFVGVVIQRVRVS